MHVFIKECRHVIFVGRYVKIHAHLLFVCWFKYEGWIETILTVVIILRIISTFVLLPLSFSTVSSCTLQTLAQFIMSIKLILSLKFQRTPTVIISEKSMINSCYNNTKWFAMVIESDGECWKSGETYCHSNSREHHSLLW